MPLRRPISAVTSSTLAERATESAEGEGAAIPRWAWPVRPWGTAPASRLSRRRDRKSISPESFSHRCARVPARRWAMNVATRPVAASAKAPASGTSTTSGVRTSSPSSTQAHRPPRRPTIRAINDQPRTQAKDMPRESRDRPSLPPRCSLTRLQRQVADRFLRGVAAGSRPIAAFGPQRTIQRGLHCPPVAVTWAATAMAVQGDAGWTRCGLTCCYGSRA